jgi:hypothetical protein
MAEGPRLDRGLSDIFSTLRGTAIIRSIGSVSKNFIGRSSQLTECWLQIYSVAIYLLSLIRMTLGRLANVFTEG